MRTTVVVAVVAFYLRCIAGIVALLLVMVATLAYMLWVTIILSMCSTYRVCDPPALAYEWVFLCTVLLVVLLLVLIEVR
jgi:uncharacterized membrane protein